MKIPLKIFALAAIALGAISCNGMMEDWQNIASGERDVIWQSVDGPAGTMNVNTGDNAFSPRLLSADGRLFAAWIENGSVIIKLYGGDDQRPYWITLPSPPYSNVSFFTMASFLGRTYIMMSVLFPDTLVMRLREDLSGWDMASPSTIEFLNNFGENLSLVVYNWALYAVWCESTTVHMRRYDGATGWTSSVEDTYGFGIDDAGSMGTSPSATVYNGHIVAAYIQNNEAIKVRAYNGLTNTWTTWFEGIHHGTGVEDRPRSSDLHSANGRLYLAWRETNTSTNVEGIWVKDITPGMPFWTTAGTSDYTGLRYHSKYGSGGYITAAFKPILGSVNGRLYVAWLEMANSWGPSPYNLVSVRARLYSGDTASPSWIFIDGAGFDGIRHNTTHTMDEHHTTAHDSKIYFIFNQQNASGINQAHVMVGY